MLGALAGHADGLGGEDHAARGRRRAWRRRRAAPSPGAPSRVTRAERRVGSRFGGVSTVTPAAPTSTTTTSSPAGEDEQLGQPAAEHDRPSRTRCRRSTVTTPPRATPAGGGAVGEAGQERLLGGVVAGGGDHRAGDDRGDERTRARSPGRAPRPRRRAPRGRSRSRRAPRGGAGPSHPRSQSVLPEGGQLLGRGLEQRPGGATGVALGQELRRRLGQGAVVFGDRDRHGRDRT